jgi:hypothetical protein
VGAVAIGDEGICFQTFGWVIFSQNLIEFGVLLSEKWYYAQGLSNISSKLFKMLKMMAICLRYR